MKGKNYLRLVLIISVTTVNSIALNQLGVDKENILMIFMVGVLLVTALTRGYRFGIIASCASPYTKLPADEIPFVWLLYLVF